MNNAKEMRWLTDQANQRREKEKQEEDARQLWLSEGIIQFLDNVRQAAMRGFKFYEETMDECPRYVFNSLMSRGFEVTVRDGALRWSSLQPREYYTTKVLTVRW